jgi:dinuclear metal center YbgI/SA1388 family protein
MPSLAEVVDLVHGWFPPQTAEEWDAVGLVAGEPEQPVRRILCAVDPTLPVAREAAGFDADLLLVHHPLFLKGIHSIARTTPKAETLGVLLDAGCALLTAHTNADRAIGGVSEAMALALGLRDLTALEPLGAETGIGRIGTVDPLTLREFAEVVDRALPATASGIRVAGDPDRMIRRVALCGGAGDSLLAAVSATDADVFVTSDLRHHLSAEFIERGGALIDVAHWAAESLWLPVVAGRLREALGDTVEVRVSPLVTDPWTFSLGAPR